MSVKMLCSFVNNKSNREYNTSSGLGNNMGETISNFEIIAQITNNSNGLMYK